MQNRHEGRLCGYLRSVVVRIVLAMTFAFKLKLSLSVGQGNENGEEVFRMSDAAKRLAEQVNQRQADQEVKARLQLHKAEVLRGKRYAFWNDFVTLFRKEFNAFNSSLNDPEYQIEEFDDVSTIYTITLREGKTGPMLRWSAVNNYCPHPAKGPESLRS